MESRGDVRPIWQLVSPLRRRVYCDLRRVNGTLELAITSGDEVFLTNTGATVEELQTTADGWRVALEAKGYLPFGDEQPGGLSPRAT